MARRILVAIDDRELGRRLIDIAARLAAARNAELLGLYVEETAFVQARHLPFSKILSSHGGSWSSLDPQGMERALRARARELERELARLAGERRLPWSFRAERGGTGECMLAAAGSVDLVVLGRSSRGRQPRLGSTARRMIMECRASVLMVTPAEALPERVTAFFAGDERALVEAEELARLFGRPLEVVVLAGHAEDGAALSRQSETWLAARGWPASTRLLNPGDPIRMAAELARHPPGLAVVSVGAGVDLDALLQALVGPVLVVR